MATVITATPRPAQGSVLVQVTGTAAEYPQDLIALTAGQITAEGTAKWTGIDSIALYGDLVAFYSTASESVVSRVLPGLIVGRRYRVTLAARRTVRDVVWGVTGRASGVIPQGSGVWAHVLEFVATATTHVFTLRTAFNTEPQVRSFALTLLPVSYDPARFSLTRTDANGTRPVRLLDGQEISGGTLIVEDSEAALVGLITYSLSTPSGALSSVTTTLEGATGYRLAPAVFPQWGVTIGLLTGYEATRPSASTVHEVIGREDPVIRLAPLKLRRGTLTVWCADYQSLLDALGVYQRGEVVLMRQPDYPGLDMYHVGTEAKEAGYDEAMRRWRLDVTYYEVAYPRGPLLGSPTWTWDDMAAMFPTWDAAAAFFATWNDAQIGPV